MSRCRADYVTQVGTIVERARPASNHHRVLYRYSVVCSCSCLSMNPCLRSRYGSVPIVKRNFRKSSSASNIAVGVKPNVLGGDINPLRAGMSCTGDRTTPPCL